MTNEQYATLGKYIIDNLNKLKSGEHRGNAVILPIRNEDGGTSRLTIEMPTKTISELRFETSGPVTRWHHYTWVPDDQGYMPDLDNR